MEHGEHFDFDLARKRLHGADWIVLSIAGREGSVTGCRWHIDAQPREIAVALRALADELDPPTA